MRSGDKEVASATVCQGPAARASMDKKTRDQSPPSRCQLQSEEGARGACPLWTWWPSAAAACDPGVGIDAAALHGYSRPPRCGQKHRGATPGAQTPTAGVVLRSRGRGGGGGAPRRRRCPWRAGYRMGAHRRRAGVTSGGWRGENGSAFLPPGCAGSTHRVFPRSAGRSGLGRFGGLGSPGPRAKGGRVPHILGGAVHRRAAGGPESGRAWEAGRSRLSQEDSAAAPARRTCGTRTWRPGAARGGAAGHRGPAAEPPCPSCPAQQQRLMPQPRLLHLGHEGAPCSR